MKRATLVALVLTACGPSAESVRDAAQKCGAQNDPKTNAFMECLRLRDVSMSTCEKHSCLGIATAAFLAASAEARAKDAAARANAAVDALRAQKRALEQSKK